MSDQAHTLTSRARGVIVHEGALLVVRHHHDIPHYCLPGGHLEWGEDPRACLVRELTEELGVVPEVGRLLFVHTFFGNPMTQTIEFLFEVTNAAAYAQEQQQAGSHAHELVETCWITPADDVTVLPSAVHEALRAHTLFSDAVRFITYAPTDTNTSS